MIRIGLISDTHGLLRPAAVDVLRGSDFIVHAGDIGENVLEALSTIAPVTAVRGNNDRAAWAERIHETEQLRFGQITLHVLHDLAQLAIDPNAAGVDVTTLNVLTGCGIALLMVALSSRATPTARRSSDAAASSTSIRAAPGRCASTCRCRWR